MKEEGVWGRASQPALARPQSVAEGRKTQVALRALRAQAVTSPIPSRIAFSAVASVFFRVRRGTQWLMQTGVDVDNANGYEVNLVHCWLWSKQWMHRAKLLEERTVERVAGKRAARTGS